MADERFMDKSYAQIGEEIAAFVWDDLRQRFPEIVGFGVGVNIRRDPEWGLKFLIMFEQEVSEEVRKETLWLIMERFFEMEVVGKIEPL